MKTLHIIAFILLIIGRINWLLIGIFGYNLVDTVFVHVKLLTHIVYIIIGAAAVYVLFNLKKYITKLK